jgi:AAA+ ATPase superfamily predicted ATPase/Holliday junction resolvase
MFRTNQPVEGAAFFDRDRELGRLLALISELAAGTPSWLAILGPRKIGKTSLIIEGARRAAGAGVTIVSIDTTEEVPLSMEFFRRYALRMLDAVLASEIGESPEALAREPNAFRAALMEAPRFGRLDATTRRFVFALPEARLDAGFVRQCLELPERLAAAFGTPLLVAIDEFQELAELSSKRGHIDPYPVMRSVWQRQKRTAYVISGSGRSMLERLVTAKSSPFFQHFALMRLGPLPEDAAVELLVEGSPRHRQIPEALARVAIQVLGARPFYLQMLGDALVQADPPYDRPALKAAIQDLLFSRTGRLSLYFENEFERMVGRSTNLSAVLEVLSGGPKRLGEIARAIGATPGQASTYLERLEDAAMKRPDGLYELDDPTFGLWLRWRRPGGSVVPMSVLGEDAERTVAEHLARSGFELVYQSRASRGAFDLLATRGAGQLGVQVKRTQLPLRFPREEWSRMEADAPRFGWRWIVAAVSAEGAVTLLDPARATRGRTVRLDARATIDNIVAWVDAHPEAQRASSAKRKKPAHASARRTSA